MGVHRVLVSLPDFKSGVAGHKPAGCVRFARAPAINVRRLLLEVSAMTGYINKSMRSLNMINRHFIGLLLSCLLSVVITTGAEALDAQAYLDKGNAAFNASKYDEAIQLYGKAISASPDFTDAYYNRGLAYYKRGRYSEAVTDFTKVLDVNPKLTDVYYNRGLANFKKGHQEKAIEDYTKALSLNSSLAEAYLNRGIAYAYSGQYDEAIDDYNKAIIVKPNYEAAYFNRGVAYVRKAAADFSKVCTMGNQAACENLKQISD